MHFGDAHRENDKRGQCAHSSSDEMSLHACMHACMHVWHATFKDCRIILSSLMRSGFCWNLTM
jgi:hypothetical protein